MVGYCLKSALFNVRGGRYSPPLQPVGDPAQGGREPGVHRGVHKEGHQRRLQPPAGDRDGGRRDRVGKHNRLPVAGEANRKENEMQDEFFMKKKCDRYGGSLDGGSTMSGFNT